MLQIFLKFRSKSPRHLQLLVQLKASQLKIYRELGFEFLKFRRWFRQLCFFHKLRSIQIPKYLYNFIPSGNCIYSTCIQDQVETYYCRYCRYCITVDNITKVFEIGYMFYWIVVDDYCCDIWFFGVYC